MGCAGLADGKLSASCTAYFYVIICTIIILYHKFNFTILPFFAKYVTNMQDDTKFTLRNHTRFIPVSCRKAFTRTRGNKETRENGGSGRDCLDKNKL